MTDRNPQTFPEALYVHVAFCASLCRYCDFASELYAPDRARGYLNALEKELRTRIALLAVPPSPCGRGQGEGAFAPRTIYIGGGTPTVLSVPELSQLLDTLHRHVDMSRVAEFTVEANPGTLDAAKLDLLRARGVNRLSIGSQSFQERLLTLLGRTHNAEQARNAVRLARAAGFDNLSLDLMHGLATQTPDELRRDLDAAIALQTEHVSAYGLAYEEGTPLADAVEAGAVQPLPSEREAEYYMTVMDALDAAGLAQYEISNYARPGRDARHNLVYWRNEAYLGIGASAASFIAWQRSTNHEDVAAYVTAVEQSGTAIAAAETLDPQARAREALVLELRMRRGVDPAEFHARWGLDVLHDCPALPRHLCEGLMERTPAGRYRISRRGLPVADGILAEFV
jgi:oxygen-independent coproporphyrinogen-3 oxidase